MPAPADPSIYHIVHVDRLASIVADGCLWCDAEVMRRRSPGTVIGMFDIKQWRQNKALDSHPGLRVGDCVPFYFCPRSVMLYVIHKANHPKLAYHGGRMILPIGDQDMQDLTLITRRGSRISSRTLLKCRFMPLVGRYAF